MSDPFNDDAPRPQIVGDGWTVRAGLSSREKTAEQAIRQAMDVLEEIAGEGKGIGSQFRAYIEHTQRDAVEALVLLAKVVPDDKETIYALQKQIAPYDHVMEWVGDMVEQADRAAEETEAMEDMRDVAHDIAQGE